MNNIISHTAKQAVDLGNRQHWRFRVIGQGEVPTEPSYRDQWWFEPVTETMHGKDRLDALRRAGVRFKGMLIAHEAPRLLTAPKDSDFKINPSIPASQSSMDGLAERLAMGLALLVGFAFQAMLSDPALIVILEDQTWLELATWYE